MSRSHILTSLVAAVALSALETRAASVPKLVVNITIDQLRSDYMEAFMPLYGDKGFRRILQEGRVYTQAEYPVEKLDRSVAIASVVTGTIPYNHGIISECWLDRSTLRPVCCVDDNDYRGVETREMSSPKYLSVSTVSDELKVASEGKALVYSIAPFRDAAILNAGHAADGAVWLDDEDGVWCSTAYYGGLPSWALVRNQYHAIGKNLKKTVWEPSSDLVGNFSYFLSKGMKTPFQYKFNGDNNVVSFKTSGLINTEVCQLAENCLRSSMMGSDDIPDYLALTLYAGNFNHMPASEGPTELQDIYVRLDGAIAMLLEAVESKVGLNNTLFVLTSTGYSDQENFDLASYRIPTGNFDIQRATSLLNMYLMAIYGQGQYVEACYGTDIYLNHKLIEEKQLNLVEVQNRSQEFLIQMSGVKEVYTSHRLLLGSWTPQISRIRNSYNTKSSGDIYVQVSPGWRLINEVTKENRLIRETYVPFPILFFGAGVLPERINTPVSVDRIAPTLAQTMRIRAPNACSSAPLSEFR